MRGACYCATYIPSPGCQSPVAVVTPAGLQTPQSLAGMLWPHSWRCVGGTAWGWGRCRCGRGSMYGTPNSLGAFHLLPSAGGEGGGKLLSRWFGHNTCWCVMVNTIPPLPSTPALTLWRGSLGGEGGGDIRRGGECKRGDRARSTWWVEGEDKAAQHTVIQPLAEGWKTAQSTVHKTRLLLCDSLLHQLQLLTNV